MAVYLIDFENVKQDGLNGIEQLEKNDKVIIFYSDNADKISFDVHINITKSSANITFRKVNVGSKNALDFQLSSYLGYLIAKKKDDKFYIVTRDNGFYVLNDFWADADIKFIESLNLNTIAETEDINSKLRGIVSDSDILWIKEVILKSDTLIEINNNLCQKYKSDIGGKIYRIIKPDIPKLQNNNQNENNNSGGSGKILKIQ